MIVPCLWSCDMLWPAPEYEWSDFWPWHRGELNDEKSIPSILSLTHWIPAYVHLVLRIPSHPNIKYNQYRPRESKNPIFEPNFGLKALNIRANGWKRMEWFWLHYFHLNNLPPPTPHVNERCKPLASTIFSDRTSNCDKLTGCNLQFSNLQWTWWFKHQKWWLMGIKPHSWEFVGICPLKNIMNCTCISCGWYWLSGEPRLDMTTTQADSINIFCPSWKYAEGIMNKHPSSGIMSHVYRIRMAPSGNQKK